MYCSWLLGATQANSWRGSKPSNADVRRRTFMAILRRIEFRRAACSPKREVERPHRRRMGRTVNAGAGPLVEYGLGNCAIVVVGSACGGTSIQPACGPT